MFEGLKEKRICVVGDVIIDRYRELKPARLSPEAPVIVYVETGNDWRAGGAANVAANTKALGAETFLVGVVGDPWPLPGFSMPCESRLVSCSGRRTTIKERQVCRNQQIARIDSQTTTPINQQEGRAIINQVLAIHEEKPISCLVFSDYEHGSLPSWMTSELIERMDGVRFVVDTKSTQAVQKFSGADIIVPNNIEALLLCKPLIMSGILQDEPSVEEMCKALLDCMSLKAVGITMGQKGIMLKVRGGPPTVFPPFDIGDRLVDATGAGDVVTATVAACLCEGMSFEESISVANVAAGISVTKWGTTTVQPYEIMAALSGGSFHG